MRRQHLELVTAASLITYAAIVLVGQAAHWIPGFGCNCHQSRAFSRSVVATNGALVSAVESRLARYSDAVAPSLNRTTLPDQRHTAIESDGDCAICQWFSMAKQPTPSVDLLLEGAALSSFTLPTSEVGHRTRSSALPRGPPLRPASFNHS